VLLKAIKRKARQNLAGFFHKYNMDPIIITGPPRSGTTWMQFFLSQHPDIHIHGQEPQLPWSDSVNWLDKMIKAGQWGKKSNKSETVKNYPIPHYAGSPKNHCEDIWRKMIHDFITGYGPQKKKRWGHKALWLCVNKEVTERLQEVWPKAKWIVCIRHPFLSFESQKNTFCKKQNIEDWIERWIESIEFYKNNESFLFQIDLLSEKENSIKKRETDKLFSFIGENPTKETDKFLYNWQVIHKVTPNHERTFKLGEHRQAEMLKTHPKLKLYMNEMGY
jgi:hypothetical protein